MAQDEDLREDQEEETIGHEAVQAQINGVLGILAISPVIAANSLVEIEAINAYRQKVAGRQQAINNYVAQHQAAGTTAAPGELEALAAQEFDKEAKSLRTEAMRASAAIWSRAKGIPGTIPGTAPARTPQQDEQAKQTAANQAAQAAAQRTTTAAHEAQRAKNEAAGHGRVTDQERDQAALHRAQAAHYGEADRLAALTHKDTNLYNWAQLEYAKSAALLKAAEDRAKRADEAEMHLRNLAEKQWETGATNLETRFRTEAELAAAKTKSETDQRAADIKAITDQTQVQSDLLSKSLPFLAAPGTTEAFNQMMKNMSAGAPQLPVASFESVAGYNPQSLNPANQPQYGGPAFPAQVPFGMPTPPEIPPPPQFGPMPSGSLPNPYPNLPGNPYGIVPPFGMPGQMPGVTPGVTLDGTVSAGAPLGGVPGLNHLYEEEP